MRYKTLVIKYEDGEEIPNTKLGEELLGGVITGRALYDVISAMDIAEEILEGADTASRKINALIRFGR